MLLNNPCQQKNCHLCCMNTSMLLSNEDVYRINSNGYDVQMFTRDHDGLIFLRNNLNRCVFHNGIHCTIYAMRPQGCTLYPLIYDVDIKKVIHDSECSHLANFPKTDDRIRQVEKLVKTIMYERKKRLEE